MADYRYAIGTVARRTSTGSQTVTGIADAIGSFTPKAVLFWATMQAASGFHAEARLMMGMSDGTTHRATCTFKENNITGLRGTRSYVTDLHCIGVNTDQPTVISDAAAISAFADGSFTLNWTANDATAWNLHYLAMGGADLGVKVTTVIQPATPQIQTVTGLGIGQLSGLIALGLWATEDVSLGVVAVASDDIPMIGWTDGVSHGCNSTHIDNFVTTTGTDRLQRTDYTVVQQSNGTDSAQNAAALLTSLDADGFTLRWDDTEVGPFDGSGNPAGLFCLAISGPAVEVGTILQSETALALSFEPDVLLLSTVGNTVTSAVSSQMRWAFGAVSRTAMAGVWLGDLDAQTTSAAASAAQTDRVIIAATPHTTTASSTVQASCVPVLGSRAVAFTWPADDSVDREILYFALEGPTLPPQPFPPASGTPTAIRKLRRTQTISDEKFWIFYSHFQLDFQSGGPRVGNDPIQVCLRYSDDSGNTWSNEQWLELDNKGKYDQIAQWFRLGRGRSRVWEVSSTSPALTLWLDAYMDADKGSHG